MANSDYISKLKEEERKVVFQNMVDLYKETWKGKSKPFTVENSNLLSKYNLSQSGGAIEADRCITSQPTEFVNMNGERQYNRRKLNELPSFLTQLTGSLAIPIIADEIVFNYRFMCKPLPSYKEVLKCALVSLDARIRCSPFNDIMSELSKFKETSSYKLSPEILETKKEIDIFSLLYLINGIKLSEHPDNYAFEVSTRLLNLFGIKPHITKLIKQLDEQSIQHCALLSPYAQLPPPGSGLLFSMRAHTTSVTEINFPDDDDTAISLSDRIVVFDMQKLQTLLNVNLPQLDEPYLNSIALANLGDHLDDNQKNKASPDKKDVTRFKRYSFLVHSLHQIYWISAQEKIKFERSSEAGFSTVELFHGKRGLAIIAEMNGSSIDCWDLLHNRLFDRIHFSSSLVQTVHCIGAHRMIIAKLYDGTIHCYSLVDWDASSFVHRITLRADARLDSLTPIGSLLLCTFDPTCAARFALISIPSLDRVTSGLDDQDILKAMLTFDPPLASKAIERIIVPPPASKKEEGKEFEFPVFIAKTSDALYVVHQCKNQNISYVKISGQYDLVIMHPVEKSVIYTSRGGLIEVHQWKCTDTERKQVVKGSHCLHKYQLYVSIDTSSAAVTAIFPCETAGENSKKKQLVIHSFYLF